MRPYRFTPPVPQTGVSPPPAGPRGLLAAWRAVRAWVTRSGLLSLWPFRR